MTSSSLSIAIASAMLAPWLVVGMVYLRDIRRYGHRKYLLRERNYRHLSHILIGFQAMVILAGIGRLSVSPSIQPVIACLGVLVLASGLLLCLWAKQTLGPFWDRHASIQVGHHLVRNGPYRWCRNPIFLGQFGLFIGAAIASLNAFALLCCLAALWSFSQRILGEEAILGAHFGAEYESYRNSVSRFWPLRLGSEPAIGLEQRRVSLTARAYAVAPPEAHRP